MMANIKILFAIVFSFTMGCKEKTTSLVVEKSVEQQIDTIEKPIEKTEELNKDSIITILRKTSPNASISFYRDKVIVIYTDNYRIEDKKYHSYLKTHDSIYMLKKVDNVLATFSSKKYRIIEPIGIYHKEYKDSLFYLKSKPFKISGIDCQWEYGVRYIDGTNKNSPNVFVELMSQKLKELNTRRIILDLDLSKFIYIPNKSPYGLEDKEYSTYSSDEMADINADGYTDIQFTTEIAAAGSNTAYATYLFNSKNNKFEYSEVFSDYNIEYDAKNNRTSSFMKSGANNYFFQFKNLNENRKDVDFIENVHHHFDTLFYEKLINGKIVLEKKIILGEEEWNWEKYLERK